MTDDNIIGIDRRPSCSRTRRSDRSERKFSDSNYSAKDLSSDEEMHPAVTRSRVRTRRSQHTLQ
jgi:hypothetical protein